MAVIPGVTFNPRIKFEYDCAQVRSVQFHPSRPWILTSHLSGEIEIRDYRQETVVHTFTDHQGLDRSSHAFYFAHQTLSVRYVSILRSLISAPVVTTKLSDFSITKGKYVFECFLVILFDSSFGFSFHAVFFFVHYYSFHLVT
jgi:WD40 repeat protein